MKYDSLRGSGLGTHSLETDRGIEYSARKDVVYDCAACGAATTLTFSADAEEPFEWECSHCASVATLRGGTAPHPDTTKVVKEAKTPFEMLLERRSRDELEVILSERLAFFRERRGAGLEDLAG